MTIRNKNGRFTAVQKEQEKTLMLTMTQAAQYMGIKKPALKRILESPKNSAIFNADTVKTTHFHDEVPDLIEIEQSALDAYQTAKVAGKVGARSTRAGRDRKYTQYISDARIAEYQSLVVRAGFSEAVPAYKAKAAKAVTTPQVVDAPADLIEEMIEA